MPDALTVVSLFAGCGGSSLGYSMAGYREVLAVEWDDHAAACFRLNFPSVPLWHGDIAKLSGEEALVMAGLKPGDLDVLDGSPPCQGFSTAGKRLLDDPRNGLFREYVRLLQTFRPKAFIMENVSGMVKGKMKLIFAEILRALKAEGYHVSARLMNAMWFHVPQSRERMIFIGIKKDLGIEPTHPSALAQPLTFRQATADIWEPTPDLAFNPGTATAQAMFRARPGEQDPKHFSRVKVHPDRPGNTLTKDFLGFLHYWHPQFFRPLTLIEWKRIGSFPDGFRFLDKKSGCSQIGNSVPPLFMRAIATHIKQLLQSLHPLAIEQAGEGGWQPTGVPSVRDDCIS